MVNQISRTMQDAISRFENRLTQAKEELLTMNRQEDPTISENTEKDPNYFKSQQAQPYLQKNLSGNPMLDTIIDDKSEDDDITEEIIGVKGKGITKSKFSGTGSSKPEEELIIKISEELNKIIVDIQSRHNIELSYELKEVTQKILNDEKLIFIKTNLFSGYQYLYEMLGKMDKKIGILL